MKNLILKSLVCLFLLSSNLLFANFTVNDSLRAEQLIKSSLAANNEVQFKKDLKELFPKNIREDLQTFFIAKYYLYTRQLDKAAFLLQKTIKKYPTDDIRTAKLYNSLGGIRTYQNNVPEGMKAFNRAISIFEKNGKINKTGIVHNNIANIYFTQLDYFSAEKHFEKAVFYLRKDKDTVFLGGVNAVYAMCLAKLKKNKKAEEELSLAFAESKKHNNILGITCSYLAKGEIFQSEKKYADAEKAYLKSLELAQTNGLGAFIMFNHVSLNKLYNIQGRFTEAVTHGEAAIPMIESSNNWSPLASAYRNLSLSYAGIKNYEKAYEFNNKALNLFRKMTSEKNKRIINELNIKYETVKKEKAIALNKVKINRLTFISLGIGFLLILVIVIYSLNRRRTKERLYRIEEQKKLDIIAANLIGEEREKERVSYELHDSISASLTALRMKIESLDIEKEKLSPITSNLETIQHETRKISHNLLPFQGGDTHFIKALENYCSENSTPAFQIKFYSPNEHLSISDIKAKTLYRIIQELVNNAMKHSQSSLCFVSLNANSEILNILVEDQGIGLKEGTKNGQGLISITKRIANIDGNIEISSFENKGTSILIEIPI